MTCKSRTFLADRRASTALEFALVSPILIAFVLGIIELGLVGFYSTLAIEGAQKGADYMRKQRLAGQPYTDAGLREAVCASISIGGLSCSADKLKIAPIYAGQPVGGSYNVPEIIENTNDPLLGQGGQYIVAVGYNWGMDILPSVLFLPKGPKGSQIQGSVYTVLAERVWDNGAPP